MTQDLTIFQPSPASIMDTFKGPPPPENEAARLQTLQMLVPTSDDDPVLASLCKLVCSLLKVPAAAVSIVERDRQYHKSTGGTCPRVATARSLSFCQYTFLPKLPTVLVVEDTLKDARFENHPLVVASPNPIRFYAGAPLIASNGHRLGAMCLVDQKPRKLSVEDYRVLNSCAEMVVRRLESECYSLMETVATDKLLRSLDAFSAPIMLCDMAARGWPILHANEAWVKRLGLSKGEDVRHYTVWDLFQSVPESQEQVVAGFRDDIMDQKAFTVQLMLRKGSNRTPMHLGFRPATQGSLDPSTPYIDVPEDVGSHENPGDDLPYYYVTIVEHGAAHAPAAATPVATARSTGGAPAASPVLNGPTPAAAPSVKAAPSADVTASPDPKTAACASAKAGDKEVGARDVIAHKAEDDKGVKQIGFPEEQTARQGCFSCGSRQAAGADKQQQQQHSGCIMC